MRDPGAGVRAQLRPSLDGGDDQEPQAVEIAEVQKLAVEEGAPVAIDEAKQEKSGQEEEVGHAKRLREGNDGVHEAFVAHGIAHAERRVHHDDEEDAHALGVVEPDDALVGLHRLRGGGRPAGGLGLGAQARAQGPPRLMAGHVFMHRCSLRHEKPLTWRPSRCSAHAPQERGQRCVSGEPRAGRTRVQPVFAGYQRMGYQGRPCQAHALSTHAKHP